MIKVNKILYLSFINHVYMQLVCITKVTAFQRESLHEKIQLWQSTANILHLVVRSMVKTKLTLGRGGIESFCRKKKSLL